MAGAGSVESFLGALQASIAVLLTVFDGTIAAQFNFLSESASKEVSKTCVQIFLPALLLHNLGSQLHAETVMRYSPIRVCALSLIHKLMLTSNVVWAIIYNATSISIGLVATRLLKFPTWVTPA